MSGLILPGEKILGNSKAHSSSIQALWDFHFAPNVFYSFLTRLLPPATDSLWARRSALVTTALIKKKPVGFAVVTQEQSWSRMTISFQLRGEMDRPYQRCRWDKWRRQSHPSGRRRFRGWFAGLKFTSQPLPTWFSSVCGMGTAIEPDC